MSQSTNESLTVCNMNMTHMTVFIKRNPWLIPDKALFFTVIADECRLLLASKPCERGACLEDPQVTVEALKNSRAKFQKRICMHISYISYICLALFISISC